MRGGCQQTASNEASWAEFWLRVAHDVRARACVTHRTPKQASACKGAGKPSHSQMAGWRPSELKCASLTKLRCSATVCVSA